MQQIMMESVRKESWTWASNVVEIWAHLCFAGLDFYKDALKNGDAPKCYVFASYKELDTPSKTASISPSIWQDINVVYT